MLAVDKTNAEARKELLKVRDKIQAAKAEDKKVRLACMHACSKPRNMRACTSGVRAG